MNESNRAMGVRAIPNSVIDSMRRDIAEADKNVRLQFAENVVAFCVISACLLLVLGAALGAEFYVVEDHHLLGLQPWSLGTWFERVQIDIQQFQRFRPLYWAYIGIGASWFGRNPHVWHFFALSWGVLSCFLFFRAARTCGADRLTSSVFVAILALASNQSWVWINLVPQETLGVLLVAISAWAFSIAAGRPDRRLWDGAAFIALALASLTKESFVLVIPALLLMRLARERQVSGTTWRECAVSLKTLLLSSATLFAAGLGVVLGIMLSKPDGYSANASGFSIASFSPLHWHELLAKLGLGLPLLAAAALLVVRAVRVPAQRQLILCAVLIVFGWVVPQLVLYSRGIDERYLFPAIIGVAAAIALGFAALPRGLFLVPQLCMLVLVVPVLTDGIRAANKTATWFAAETVSVDRMVKYLAQNTPPSQALVVAADPGTGYGYEALYSLPIYLKLANSHSSVYAWPLETKGDRNAGQGPALSEGTVVEHPSSLNPRNVGAIILIDTFTPGLKMDPIQAWLANSEWKELRFVEGYRHFSDKGIFKTETSEVVHRALVSVGLPTLTSDGMLSVDPAVASNVGVGPGIDGPPWGLERDYAGPGMIAWIGHGDAEGIGGTLTARSKQEVTVAVDIVAGPSLPGSTRSAELVVAAGEERKVVRGAFSGGQWAFPVELNSGLNTFRLRVLDRPSVAKLPNGDERTLMALVRHITVRE